MSRRSRIPEIHPRWSCSCLGVFEYVASEAVGVIGSDFLRVDDDDPTQTKSSGHSLDFQSNL